MNIRFYLAYPKKEKSAINISVSYNAYVEKEESRTYKPIRIALPVMVSTSLWNNETKRMQETGKSAQEARVVNALLSRVESSLKVYYNKCLDSTVQVTEAGIVEAIEKGTGQASKKRKRIPLAELVERTMTDSASGEREKDEGGKLKEHSTRQYANCLYHIDRYQTSNGVIYVDALNEQFAKNWSKYLDNSGASINTKAKINRKINASLNYAFKLGLIEKCEFKASVKDVVPDTIALTREEVDRLYALDLSTDAMLERVRDLFLVGVWTMLRFSDYRYISSLSVTDDDMLKIFMTKIDRAPALYLPIHSQLRAILEKYSYQLPKAPVLQVFNKQLKRLCKEAGITKMEEVRDFKHGVVKKKFVQRWELISSHTARRTGATLLYLAGVPKRQIMLITGHNTEEIFDRYVRIGQRDNALKLAEHSIFKE